MSKSSHPQYTPHRKDANGKLVPVAAREPSKFDLIRDVIATANADIKKSGGGLEAITLDHWDELMALLPLCECEAPIAPIRVIRGAKFCNDECRERSEKRGWAQRRRESERAARAISNGL